MGIDGPLLLKTTGPAPAGVVHGFTTRAGGVSTGPLASLNLAARPGETSDALEENWDRVLRSLDPRLRASRVALLSQVHGAVVVRVDAPLGPHTAHGEADAAVTTELGVALAVRVADCVPVLLASPRGVAVAHAGWRGTAGGVVAATVQALLAATAEAPEAVRAFIGPHISAEAYEVGEEVVEGLRASGLPEGVFRRRGPRRDHVDLGAAVAWQLESAGVCQIHALRACTARDDRFYSHRRDGAATGRLAGVIARMEA